MSLNFAFSLNLDKEVTLQIENKEQTFDYSRLTTIFEHKNFKIRTYSRCPKSLNKLKIFDRTLFLFSIDILSLNRINKKIYEYFYYIDRYKEVKLMLENKKKFDLFPTYDYHINIILTKYDTISYLEPDDKMYIITSCNKDDLCFEPSLLKFLEYSSRLIYIYNKDIMETIKEEGFKDTEYLSRYEHMKTISFTEIQSVIKKRYETFWGDLSNYPLIL